MKTSNFNVSHHLAGEGQTARVDVVDIERGASHPSLGELSDISAELLLRFDDLNPYTYTERSISILNYTLVFALICTLVENILLRYRLKKTTQHY